MLRPRTRPPPSGSRSTSTARTGAACYVGGVALGASVGTKIGVKLGIGAEGFGFT